VTEINSFATTLKHAQTRFIEVTKAYNNLRGFYRKHQPLPLQNPALQDATTANIHASQVSKRTAKHKVHNVDELIFEPSSNVVKNPHFKYWMLAIPAVGLFVTIAMFVVLERRLAEKQRAAAIDVLRSTTPSEFMPDRESMRRHSSRKAAFGKP